MTQISFRVSPVLGVPNVRQAAEYYRDVLGFTLDPRDGIFQPPGTEPSGVYAIVKLGGAWIHFQLRRDAPEARERQKLERDAYVYLHGLEAFYADLQRRGATILQQPCDTPYGIREFVIEDLNGYRIAFGQPT